MGPNEGVPTLFAYCEKIIQKFFFKFSQGTYLPFDGPCLDVFRDFPEFFFLIRGGGVVANHL